MDYDMTIHHNTDAQAWAKLFIETTKDMDRDVFRDEGYMIAWFANAMMAMYDSMDPQKAANEILRLRKSRNEILEEAALNAEGFGGSTNDAKNYWAREISESIRTLKEKA